MNKAMLVLIAAMLVPSASAVAQSEQVAVELNKLEPSGDACRAYLVLENLSDSAFATLKLDLVLFDAEGVVARRLAVETAPLQAGKTSLKVFDVESLACADVGRVLLNDVMACADAAGPRENCLGLVEVRARGGLAFVK